jgi:hypothetical protein
MMLLFKREVVLLRQLVSFSAEVVVDDDVVVLRVGVRVGQADLGFRLV